MIVLTITFCNYLIDWLNIDFPCFLNWQQLGSMSRCRQWMPLACPYWPLFVLMINNWRKINMQSNAHSSHQSPTELTLMGVHLTIPVWPQITVAFDGRHKKLPVQFIRASCSTNARCWGCVSNSCLYLCPLHQRQIPIRVLVT